MKFAFIPAANGNYTILINGVTKTVRPSHPFYNEIVSAIYANDEESLKGLLEDVNKTLSVELNNALEEAEIGNLKLSYDNRTGQSTVIYNDNVELPAGISNMLVRLWRHGCKNLEHYSKFIENIMANPVEGSRESLFDFLSVQELPITENGTFIAYKALESSMYSITGNKSTRVLLGKTDEEGHILNSVGSTIRIVFDDVDTDRNEACSTGLHVGSYKYACDFVRKGGVIVAVEVNPAHVISVPYDCGCTKCRVSEYKVLEVVENEFSAPEVEVKDDCTVKEVQAQPINSKAFSTELVRKLMDKEYIMKLERKICDYMFKKDDLTFKLEDIVKHLRHKTKKTGEYKDLTVPALTLCLKNMCWLGRCYLIETNKESLSITRDLSLNEMIEAVIFYTWGSGNPDCKKNSVPLTTVHKVLQEKICDYNLDLRELADSVVAYSLYNLQGTSSKPEEWILLL